MTIALVLALACKNDAGGEPGTGPGATAASPDLVFTDANNYDFTASLALDAPIALAGADVVVDWSGIRVDYRGRALDPASVDQVTIAAIELEHDDLLEQINANGLSQEDIQRYYQVFPSGQTSVTFGEMSILGQPFDFANEFVEGFSPSWLLTIWGENERGVLEILSSQFVVPDPAGPDTVGWGDDTAVLTFEPDLGAPPIRTVAAADAWSLDWTAVTVDVNGAPYDPLLGDTLRIAHLPVTDVAEAEGSLLRVDEVADGTWFADVFGAKAVDDLAVATALDGSPFPGFTTDGVWIVSVECTQLSCFSPAPLILAVVEVE